MNSFIDWSKLHEHHVLMWLGAGATFRAIVSVFNEDQTIKDWTELKYCCFHDKLDV